jgi:rubrerythrin
MSNSNVKEVLDVEMCYMALGLSMGDSPEQIDLKYRQLLEGCKKESLSPNPKVRENARDLIILFENAYDRIKTSVTYQTTAKEHEKKIKEKALQAEIITMKCTLIHCPYCSALIGKALKSCPSCKADFRTKVERLSDKYSTKTCVTVCVLLILVGIMICLGFSYRDQIETLVMSLMR